MFPFLPSGFAATVFMCSRYGCMLGGARRQLQSENIFRMKTTNWKQKQQIVSQTPDIQVPCCVADLYKQTVTLMSYSSFA